MNQPVTSDSERPQKEPWYKAVNSIAVSISVVLVPIIVAVLGNQFSESENFAKQRAEYIKLGVNILNEKPSEENKALRKWAVDLINYYSDVKMDHKAEEELVNKITLSLFATTYEKYDGRIYTDHEFSWVGDNNAPHSFEIEQLISGEWVNLTGFSFVGTNATVSIPLNVKLRWRAKNYESDGSLKESSWEYLFVEGRF